MQYLVFIATRQSFYYYPPFWKIFIACGGQTFSHAMQNMQSFSLAMNAFFSDAGCPGVSSQS